MRVMQSDLAILNAAQYEDGDTFKRALKESPPSRGGPGTKKRPRTVFGDEPALGDAEEEKKRSRGRPRLDPTDQTAQDVSRTRIALAT